MKVKASIKKRSEDCKIVKRKGKLYVICKKNPTQVQNAPGLMVLTQIRKKVKEVIWHV